MTQTRVKISEAAGDLAIFDLVYVQLGAVLVFPLTDEGGIHVEVVFINWAIAWARAAGFSSGTKWPLRDIRDVERFFIPFFFRPAA